MVLASEAILARKLLEKPRGDQLAQVIAWYPKEGVGVKDKWKTGKKKPNDKCQDSMGAHAKGSQS